MEIESGLDFVGSGGLSDIVSDVTTDGRLVSGADAARAKIIKGG